MKICAIICEYNPLHNGHVYLLQKAKERADFVLCLMSGNFTQRGQLAILHKSMRAKHAILAGADVVIELPTIYSLSSAEFFAKGAVHILSSIPAVQELVFGCETDNLEKLKQIANLQENVNFQSIIAQQLKKGNSYIRSKTKTLQQLNLGDLATLASTPNNILAIAYLKAIDSLAAKITPTAIQRKGAGYLDENIYCNFSSATAIRKAVLQKHIEHMKGNLPQYVYTDLMAFASAEHEKIFGHLATYSLLKDKTFYANIQDCNEGLDNRLYELACKFANYHTIIQQATSRRYTTTRIARILANGLLQIDKGLLQESFIRPLYLKVLAIKKESVKQLLPLLTNSAFTVLTQAKQQTTLPPFAHKVYQKDKLAEQIYKQCTQFSLQTLQIVDV